MPAVNKQQRNFFNLVLAVKKGKTKRSEVSKDVLDAVDSMSVNDIKKYAHTKNSELKESKNLKPIPLFEQYLIEAEKQLKIPFAQYQNDDHPDKLQDVGHEYINKYKVPSHINKPSISFNELQSWFEQNKDIYMRKCIDEDETYADNQKLEMLISYNPTYRDITKEYLTDIRKIDMTGKEITEFSDIEDIDSITYNDPEELNKYIFNHANIDLSDIVDDQYYYEMMDWISDCVIDPNDAYIYRAFNVPHKIENMDLLTYNGVGIFWSYKQEGAVAHCGDSHFNTMTVTARIVAGDINKEQTLYKSLWNLADELEIEIILGTTVEIISFQISSGHPIVRELVEKDIKYLESIGIKDPYHVVKNKGNYEFVFETPIIVKA